MGVLDEMKNFQNFANGEAQNELLDIVEEIKKYDVYNILARISAMNLVYSNQNKSMLMDSLIAKIIKEEEGEFASRYIASPGKFKKMMKHLNETSLRIEIDSNENSFIQNIMFFNNYKVFNGIDCTPAYNLQKMIYVLFVHKNKFPEMFLKQCSKVISFCVGLSDDIAKKINVNLYQNIESIDINLVVPDAKTMEEYADSLCINADLVRDYLNDEYLFNGLCDSFGNNEYDDFDYRSFYSKPFIHNKEKNELIILNISLLPNYLFFKVLELAALYGIKEEVINSYNNFVFKECRKYLKKLGHQKIEETSIGIELINNDYYKEMLVNVFNNQVMIVLYVCDDAFDYRIESMHSPYPDNRHTEMVERRIKHLRDKILENGLNNEDIYCLLIISGFGRGIGISTHEKIFCHDIIKFNPFELNCVSINEKKKDAFLPRYIRAKSKLQIFGSGLFSELDLIEIYESNNNTFYMGDDFNSETINMFIAPGDSIEYIARALKKESRRLVDSYQDGYYTEIILDDPERNIFIEDRVGDTINLALYVQYKRFGIWVRTNEIKKIEELNIYYSIVDMVSYWLAAFDDLFDIFEENRADIQIVMQLSGSLQEYYYDIDEEISYEDSLEISIDCRKINIIWTAEAFRSMKEKSNAKEKEFMTILLNIILKCMGKHRDIIDDIESVFKNPLRKKFFSLDYFSEPYLKPVEQRNNHYVHGEDEDYLLDGIGKELLASGNWKKGIIEDEDRGKIANEVVANLYNRLQKEIEKLNPHNLIELIYNDLECVLYNMMLTERRYASDIACYPEKEENIVNDYNEQNKTSLALKFLIEYVAAKPPSGETYIGEGNYEYILAICFLIIDWAYKNDLFHYGIFNTQIEILESERIGMKHDEFENMYEKTDTLRRKKLYYVSSSDFRKKYTLNKVDYNEQINKAFAAEYGYSMNQLCNVVVGMLQYSENLEEKTVFVENENDLITWLCENCLDIDKEIVSKIIENISLKERDDFLTPPKPYRKEDIYPWRFNREYSFIRRPVIKRNNEIIWGNRLLYHMIQYMYDLIDEEKLKARSPELKQLLGRISEDRGNAFNDLIFRMLNDCGAFIVKSNVKKINKRHLSDENNNALGDVDILLIDNEYKTIVVAEVKDFRVSRNPYEMNLEFQKMFVDSNKKKCFATKHKKRVEWINNHVGDVICEYKLNSGDWKVVGIFIVNEPLISNSVYGKGLNVLSKMELSVEKIREMYK